MPTLSFYKDRSELQTAPLAPSPTVSLDPVWPPVRKQLALVHNRIGGLVWALGSAAQVDPRAALAVWYVESSGRSQSPGRALIRFENHLFFRLWGRRYPDLYDRHFRHGGRNDQPGRSWENHVFREQATGPFQSFHGKQDLEYQALDLAIRLAGDTALPSISIGGPQILVSNFGLLGYATPRAMFDAFQADERAHVLGFFDFCNQQPAPRPGDLIVHLRNLDWPQFARGYNGKGQVDVYAPRLTDAYTQSSALPVTV